MFPSILGGGQVIQYHSESAKKYVKGLAPGTATSSILLESSKQEKNITASFTKHVKPPAAAQLGMCMPESDPTAEKSVCTSPV